MEYRNDIYIGEKIEQLFNERKINISQFAKAIRSSRTNVYNIFKAKSIDTDKLVLISKVLDYPFLEEYLPKLPPTENTHIVLDIEVKNGKCSVRQIEGNG